MERVRLGTWFCAAALMLAGAGANAGAREGWRPSLEGVAVPHSPASGRLGGAAFRVERAELHSGVLTLHQGGGFLGERTVSVFLFDFDRPDGRAWHVQPGRRFGNPHVHLSSGAGPPEAFQDRYALVLELGRRRGDTLAGRIYLCLPDGARSYVAGSFVARIR
jgi:hypothetical protein